MKPENITVGLLFTSDCSYSKVIFVLFFRAVEALIFLTH